MLPYKTILNIDKALKTPLYLQICNEFIRKISSGVVPPNHKLPGSRNLAKLLEVNRRTVISAYEEMEAQGWVEIKANKGCFVSSKLPLQRSRVLDQKGQAKARAESHFQLNQKLDFLAPYIAPDLKNIKATIDAGYPDVRLMPAKQLVRNLSTLMQIKQTVKLLNYASDFNGDLKLREEIVKYLAATRSINVGLENVIITRGSLMAFFNIFQVLLSPGDKVIVGEPSFKVANDIIRIAQGEIIRVPVDEMGIDVDAVETQCQREKIRAIFIMPHHHNPTVVSLSAERRMKLLMLAEQYGFAIIEDDYDYDFHYARSPILPMASADQTGVVVYVGSLSKTVAPGLRIGFVVAPADFIEALSRLSRFIDCHGNPALERAIAMLFKEDEIKRHLKKALKIYHARRDLFCHSLKEALQDKVDFQIPEGGLAAWVKFDPSISISALKERALQKGLLLPKSIFCDSEGEVINGIRMGFASLDESEIEKAIKLLKASMPR